MFCSKEQKEVEVLLQKYAGLEKSEVTLEARTKNMVGWQAGREIEGA